MVRASECIHDHRMAASSFAACRFSSTVIGGGSCAKKMTVTLLCKNQTLHLLESGVFLDTIYTRFFHRINRGSPWILWFFKVYHLISYHIWWIYESYMMDIWYYMMIYIYMDQIFSHRYLKVSDASPPKALPWHRAWTELASAPGNRNTTDKGSFVYKGKMTQQEHHL